ncbi:MAG TPA: Na+/H+ antiporter NhaA, partial [Bacteroidales bacterium]|nr:Na+/H+ antiporter NhaA [Bacteroidales bacterium]
MRLTKLLNGFFNSDKSGGMLLITATVLSLVLANSDFRNGYIQLWHFKLYEHSLVHWVNEGLMAFFFLLVGLELKREILAGKLSSLKSASFPVIGAIGGMLVPASLFTILNFGT